VKFYLIVKFVGEVAKMPKSLKQLDQRYEVVCNNIEDAKKFSTEKLDPKIEVHAVAFSNSLEQANLDEVEASIDNMEQVISQFMVAVKNEHSRRLLQDQIVKLTHKKYKKEEEKRRFKLQQRYERLVSHTLSTEIHTQ